MFSIETAHESIYEAKTKEYFKEVVSSYTNGNFRSAVVMLYSIVVCDLVFKLEDLKNIYNDATASDILTQIEKLRKANPNSPAWESEIIEKVYNRTELLEVGDYQNIHSLQKHRHLSAHPVMNKSYALFAPNKETVRAHIRNMLEGVLIKPPILSKKVVNTMLEDLERSKNILIDDRKLELYVEAKYLKNLSLEVELEILKTIWKLCFKAEDQKCDMNRDINVRLLSYICNKRKENVKICITSNKAHFSNIGSQVHQLNALNRFLGNFPEFYNLLQENAKVLLSQYLDNDFDSFIIGWYVSGDLKSHFGDVLRKIEDDKKSGNEAFDNLISIAKKFDVEQDAYNLLIQYLGKSDSYDRSDRRFIYLEPHLSEMNSNNLTNLVKVINSNNQLYGRRHAIEDNRTVKEALEKALGTSFDFTPFPNFKV